MVTSVCHTPVTSIFYSTTKVVVLNAFYPWNSTKTGGSCFSLPFPLHPLLPQLTSGWQTSLQFAKHTEHWVLCYLRAFAHSFSSWLLLTFRLLLYSSLLKKGLPWRSYGSKVSHSPLPLFPIAVLSVPFFLVILSKLLVCGPNIAWTY